MPQFASFRVPLLAAGLLLAGCTAAKVELQPPSGDEVTLFLHGIKGSFLVTEGPNPERAWLSAGDVLTPGDRSLALPFPGQRPATVFGPLRPDGPMTRLTLVPLLVEREIYLSWLRYGRDRLPGFIALAYDWRQDARHAAAELGALIDRLETERKSPLKINLVGHSLGGLIVLHYLRHGAGAVTDPPTWAGARHVRRAVFVGSPFLGAPGLLQDILLGSPTGRNRALLPAEALFTFPSIFELLPSRDDFTVGPEGEPVQLDALSADSWIAQGWGVFADPSLRTNPAYRAQLERMLEANRAFAAARDGGGPPPEHLQALVVVGHGQKTVTHVRAATNGFDFAHPVEGDGDALVPAERATPSSLPFQRLDVREPHETLLSNREVQAAIARFLGVPP